MDSQGGQSHGHWLDVVLILPQPLCPGISFLPLDDLKLVRLILEEEELELVDPLLQEDKGWTGGLLTMVGEEVEELHAPTPEPIFWTFPGSWSNNTSGSSDW